MSEQIQITQKGEERLKKIEKIYKVPYKELFKQYEQLLNDPSTINNPTFKTPEQRMDYCSKVLKSRYFTRAPIDAYTIYILGIGRKSTTKSGTERAEIFVVTQDKNKQTKELESKLHTLSLTGADVEKLEEIQTGCVYESVKLIRFKTGDFKADDRSIFSEPLDVEMPILEVLNDLKIRRCTVAEADQNIVKRAKTSTGNWPVKTDMRIIRGIITNHSVGHKDGFEWGIYTIYDDSLDEQKISDDGNFVTNPAFTIWVNPIWVTLEKGNEVDFVGTIDYSTGSKANPKNKPYQISMSASLLIPVNQMFGEIQTPTTEDE